MKYKVNVSGCVHDTATDFKCGFEVTVENGGSVENIGKSIQTAIDSMSKAAEKVEAGPSKD